MEQPLSYLNNATSFLPSSMDLLLVVPRLLQRAGSFADHIDLLGKIRHGGSMIAEPTASNTSNATVITSIGTFAQQSLAAAATAALEDQDIGISTSPWQTMRNIGGFFSYMTSKWAIATFTTAILLNRTTFYASSRIPLVLNRWTLRLTLYLMPAIIFLYRIQWILQAIRCQTSPNWVQMQYGDTGKALDVDFGGEGGLMWRLASTILFWEDEEASCRAANMFPTDPSLPRPAGSLSLLWPLFVSLAFSQFVETLACALQNRQPVPETGMTIFEHSLAFAEAEAVVTRPFGLETSRFYRPTKLTTPDGSALLLSRSAISQFANVPPEVLVISLISSLSHLTSSVLAIIGVRAKFRLVSTGTWGLAYMSAFLWSFFRAANTLEESELPIGILRFPTVCIVGFIPHLLLVIGIMACGLIYGIAFWLTVLYPPPGQAENLSLRNRMQIAYQNLQANIHLSAITPLRINWQEDFYTAILKCGFTILTSASEAVYLNEGMRVTAGRMTWIEEKRVKEITARRRPLQRALDTIPPELLGDFIAEGVASVHSQSLDQNISGYARERKTRGANAASEASRAVGRDTGVGLQQRRGRWTLTWQFLKGIFWLVIAIYAKASLALLRKLRVPYTPRWLLRLAGPDRRSKGLRKRGAAAGDGRYASNREFLLLDENGQLHLPTDRNVDVEALTRVRLQDAGFYEEHNQGEEQLNTTLYDWWKTGGWWGDIDTSGDYEDPNATDFDDTTSIISFITTTEAETEDENDWSDMDSGQRTPTQASPYPYSRDSTPAPAPTPDPDALLDTSRLAHLLDPKTPEQREEARLLSRHLQTPGILTRSRYRQSLQQDQLRLLSSSRFPLPLSAADEESLLENFILERRAPAHPSTSSAASGGRWDSGAEGMGAEGPQCVVCQLAPRTVLVWPCGCLSLCDECRVGLASKNYTTCVCCRTNVVAYSRLYVP